MTGDLFPDTINEDPNRRYTKPENVRWIEQQLQISGWHLDPAADEASHHAPRYFSVIPYPTSAGVNGLDLSWLPNGAIVYPHCILLNPPWDDLDSWARKLWFALREHYEARIQVLAAFVVPGDRHEQKWWQRYVEPYRIEKHPWQRARTAPDPDMPSPSTIFLNQLEVRVHCPPERWEYNSPGGGSKNNAFFPSAVIEFRSRWTR